MPIGAKRADSKEHFEVYAADGTNADHRAVLDEDPDTGMLAFVRECVYALIALAAPEASCSIDASGISDFLIGISLNAQFSGDKGFTLFLPSFFDN
jgi:hypothetical protein